MTTFINVVTAIKHIAVALAAIGVLLAALQLRQTLTAVDTAVASIGGTANSVSVAVNDVDARITRKGGLADIVQATMLHVDRVAGETAITARQQRKYWDDTGAATVRLVQDADLTVMSVKETQMQVGQDVHRASVALIEDIGHVGPLLDQGTKTLADADKLVNDPAVTTSFSNIALATANIADITKHTDEMAVDFQGSLHSHLHPTRKAIFFGGLWQIGKIAATHIP